MIVKLPKKPIYTTEDIFIPDDKPEVYLTAIKGGWMLYNIAGSLIGQIFADKEGATFVVGDSRAYRVTYDLVDVHIAPLIPDEKAIRYDVFGDVRTYRYDLYEYRHNSIKPEKVAKVTPCSAKEYSVELNEKGNVYRNLLLAVTITLLIERN